MNPLLLLRDPTRRGGPPPPISKLERAGRASPRLAPRASTARHGTERHRASLRGAARGSRGSRGARGGEQRGGGAQATPIARGSGVCASSAAARAWAQRAAAGGSAGGARVGPQREAATGRRAAGPGGAGAATMIALFNKLLDWFKALFWKEEMELTLVGLQYSGKTTFVNVIAVRGGLGDGVPGPTPPAPRPGQSVVAARQGRARPARRGRSRPAGALGA